MSKVTRIDRDVAAFIADTQHLSVEEIGAYQVILDQILIKGQDAEPPSLPDDDRSIAMMLGWPVAKWKRCKQVLCDGQLAVLTRMNGRITQIRTAAEILEAKKRIASASTAGKASGVARQKAKVREQLNVRSATVDDPLTIRSNGNASSVDDPFQRIGNGTSTNNQEPITTLSSREYAREKRPRNRRSENTPLPDGFPGPAEIEWAVSEKHVTRDQALSEAEKFRSRQASTGAQYSDWPATWRTWILRYLTDFRPADRPKDEPYSGGITVRPFRKEAK